MFHPGYSTFLHWKYLGCYEYHDYLLHHYEKIFGDFFFWVVSAAWIPQNGIMRSNIWPVWWLLLWLTNFFREVKNGGVSPYYPVDLEPTQDPCPMLHRDMPILCPGPWAPTLYFCSKVLARLASRLRPESLLGKLTHAGLCSRLTSAPERSGRGNAASLSIEKARASCSRGEEDTELNWKSTWLPGLSPFSVLFFHNVFIIVQLEVEITNFCLLLLCILLFQGNVVSLPHFLLSTSLGALVCELSEGRPWPAVLPTALSSTWYSAVCNTYLLHPWMNACGKLLKMRQPSFFFSRDFFFK